MAMQEAFDMAGKMQPLNPSSSAPEKAKNRRRSKSTELLQTSELDPNSAEIHDFPAAVMGSPVAVMRPTPMAGSPKWRDGVTPKIYDGGKEVVISNQQLKDGDAHMIVGLLADNVVQKLVLSDNQLGDAAMSEMAPALASNTSLTYLSLAKNAITDLGAEKLAKALQANGSLETCFLNNNSLTLDGKDAIADANRKRGAKAMRDGLNGLVL